MRRTARQARGTGSGGFGSMIAGRMAGGMGGGWAAARAGVAAAVALAASGAGASPWPAVSPGIALKAGTEGAGLELELGLDERFGARLQVDAGALSHHLNKTDVDYSGHLHLMNVLALLDWHPFGGAWRLSPGLVYNDNRFDLTGQATGGTYTLNGTAYPAASIGSLQGSLGFTRINPYLGTGWGVSPRGRGLYGSVDLGLQYQPSHVSLAATCGAAIAGSAACAQLAADTAAEQARLQDRTHNLRFWPVIQLGIGWKF